MGVAAGYERLEQGEPTNLIGLLTAAIGFVVLYAANGDALQSAATALGMAGSQAALTRQGVYSPKSLDAIRRDGLAAPQLADLIKPAAGRARDREPVLATALVTLVGGFLVQFLAGVDMTEALATAAGLAGVQGAATRGRVYSPAHARETALAGILADRLADLAPEERRAVGFIPAT